MWPYGPVFCLYIIFIHVKHVILLEWLRNSEHWEEENRDRNAINTSLRVIHTIRHNFLLNFRRFYFFIMSHLRWLILFGILFASCCCCFVYFVIFVFLQYLPFYSFHNTSQRKPPNLGTRSRKIYLLLGFSKLIWTLSWKSFKNVIARPSRSPFLD